MWRTLATVALLAACAEEPGWAPIEVRPSGGTVEGVEVSCSEGLELGVCAQSPNVIAYVTGQDLNVTLRLIGFVGLKFRFELEGNDVIGVETRHVAACDDGGCLTVDVPTGGWIARDVGTSGLLGRQVGTFHLEFEDGTVDGTYDTAPP